MIIKEHAQERFWLERRLEFLNILDEFYSEALYNNNTDIQENDPRLVMIRKHYADVLEPYTLSQTIKSLYPEHLYGDKKNKFKYN